MMAQSIHYRPLARLKWNVRVQDIKYRRGFWGVSSFQAESHRQANNSIPRIDKEFSKASEETSSSTRKPLTNEQRNYLDSAVRCIHVTAV